MIVWADSEGPDAQADLDLCGPNTLEDTFLHDAANII